MAEEQKAQPTILEQEIEKARRKEIQDGIAKAGSVQAFQAGIAKSKRKQQLKTQPNEKNPLLMLLRAVEGGLARGQRVKQGDASLSGGGSNVVDVNSIVNSLNAQGQGQSAEPQANIRQVLAQAVQGQAAQPTQSQAPIPAGGLQPNEDGSGLAVPISEAPLPNPKFGVTKVTGNVPTVGETSASLKELGIAATAKQKGKVLEAEEQFNVKQAEVQLEAFSDQFEITMDEIIDEFPEALDTGFEGWLARKGVEITSSRFIDELPEVAALKANIKATATPLAKLSGEDRLTNEDIERFLQTLFDPTKRSLDTNLAKMRVQINKIRKQGRNPDYLQRVHDRLQRKSSIRKATKKVENSNGRLQLHTDKNGVSAVYDVAKKKYIKEI